MPQQGCQGIPVEEAQVSLQSQQASSCCQLRSWPSSRYSDKYLHFWADKQMGSQDASFPVNDLRLQAVPAACMIHEV